MIDNQTGDTIVMLFSGFVLCFCAYLVALAATSSYKYSPNPFNPIALLRECIGMVVRRLRKLPRVPEHVQSVRWFDLGRGIVPDFDEALFRQLCTSHYWAYPASQQRMFQHQLRQASSRAEFEAEIERMAATGPDRERQRAARAQAHRAAQQGTEAPAAPAPRPATGWRRVLGLQSVETDAETIKKAYRKRVSAAHPDRGGTSEAAAALNDAFAQAREELAFV